MSFVNLFESKLQKYQTCYYEFVKKMINNFPDKIDEFTIILESTNTARTFKNVTKEFALDRLEEFKKIYILGYSYEDLLREHNAKKSKVSS